MKRFLLLGLFAVTSVSNAGDYYYANRVDTYDPITGLYYKAVINKEDRGFMGKSGSNVANIAITNPATDVVSLLFKEPLQGNVTSVVFETGFKDGSIEFYGANQPYVQNNAGIAKRGPRNKLMVAVSDKEQNETALYVAEKNGSNLKKIAVVPRGDDWHLDVKNAKVRVVHQIGNTIKVESHDW